MLTFVRILASGVRMLNKPTDTISSLAKGLRVIECFSADAPRLSISDVARMTGHDRATARLSAPRC